MVTIESKRVWRLTRTPTPLPQMAKAAAAAAAPAPAAAAKTTAATASSSKKAAEGVNAKLQLVIKSGAWRLRSARAARAVLSL